MSNEHVKEMLRRIGCVFGFPKAEDMNEFYKEYYFLLSDFSESEIKEATDELMRSHKYKNWPTVAECLMTVVKARNKLAMKDGIPPADVKGTGWRISENTGKKWYRIERGSREFLEWCKYYRINGQQNLSNFIMKHGYSFVSGEEPTQHGPAMLAYLRANAVVK